MGVAVGGVAVASAGGRHVMGINFAALPDGAIANRKNGVTFYLNGSNWLKPSYGANGVYYTVVSASGCMSRATGTRRASFRSSFQFDQVVRPESEAATGGARSRFVCPYRAPSASVLRS